MRGLTLLIICQLIIMSHITAVWAEEESVKVKDVVITATKTEVEIEDVPASVEVITKEEIKAKGAEKLRDIIGFATGIYKEPYFAREDSSVGIRGFKPEQTLILIDGRRLTGEVSLLPSIRIRVCSGLKPLIPTLESSLAKYGSL